MSTVAPARTAPTAASGRDTDAAYLAAIGERVREIRARRGMSRRTLAQDSGVSERYLASLESGRGNVSILLLKQIAQAIDVPVEQLTRNGPQAPTEVALLMQWLSRLSAPEIRRATQTLHRALGAGGHERKRRIALIGLRGAGKTTLGKRLAARRRVPFIELDREIEQAAGASLAELFLLYGLPAYRRHERRALEALLLRDEAMVIATGGSI
ncbi:MAG TPA: shikimate kinase, partial [Casimicrobiaceae bacterium]|nr:shikimate kinase [Casimicrobiaceae bacterium]